MRVLILGLNYRPESTSIGPYTADLAEHLVGRGHAVQVVTGFPQAPRWRIWDDYRGRRFQREVVNGVPVLRTYMYVPRRPDRTIARVLFDVTFAATALVGALPVQPVDVVVAVSPPLQLALSAWVISLLQGARLFLHLQDLVPDAAVAVGAMREGSRAVELARILERFVYCRARGIGVICDGFARNLAAKGVPSGKVVVLPNFVDLEFLRPTDRDNSFRMRHGIPSGRFLVMYSGSVARKQGLQTFVESAAALRDDGNVAFWLVGEGPGLPMLRARADELGLSNLGFLPLQPGHGLPQQLGAADALVITQRRAVTDYVFPGKLLCYMAAERPIVAAVSTQSETGRFVRDHQVGLVVPPEDSGALAQAVGFLQSNPGEARLLGRNGRRVAEERFDRRVVLERFAEHLEKLARESSGSR